MRKAKGQSLVEFALIIPLFLALMMGILDGTRLLFAYNELQEAAHAGARWGAVEVGRKPWGQLSNSLGLNTSNTNALLNSYPLAVSGNITPTIAGEVAGKLIAVDHSQTYLNIGSTTGITEESGTLDGAFRVDPVTVTVSYTFVPIISFGHVHIPLVGRATAYHE